jgi:hypothetical protein
MFPLFTPGETIGGKISAPDKLIVLSVSGSGVIQQR